MESQNSITDDEGDCATGEQVRQRRHRIWTRRIVIVCAAALCAYWWGPDAYRRVNALYCQRQCDQFAPAIGSLPQKGPPDCLRRISATARHSFYDDDLFPFVHRLTSAGGTSRLVVVRGMFEFWEPRRRDSAPPRPRHAWRLSGDAWALSPATWRCDAGQSAARTTPFDIVFALADRAEIFGGQPDPTDTSHFTIAYAVDGVRGTIDGWLLDDGTVKLETRDGPAKAYN